MKFSLGKFGVKSDGSNDITIRLVFSDSLKGVVATSKVIIATAKFEEKLRGSVLSTRGTPFILQLKSLLNNKVEIVANIPSKSNYREVLDSSSSAIKDINILQKFLDVVDGNVYASKDMLVNLGEFKGELKKYVLASKNIPIESFVSELLNVDVSSVFLEKDILKLNTTLKPGESIEIDSSSFTAFKGDQNILHLHKGDWIKISRNTTFIDIDSGTGGKLEGQISYTERYL